MNPTLEKRLYDKYPLLFKEHDKPMNETAMCWGCQCSDGWFDIIDAMCEALTHTYTTSAPINPDDGKRLGIKPSDYNGQYYVDIEAPKIILTTVKEKFGTLRVYHRLEYTDVIKELVASKNNPKVEDAMERYSNYFDGIIHFAEVLSGRTCENTGKPGEMHVSGGSRGGWYRVLNKEYAQTDPFIKDRNYVPVSTLKENKE